MRLFFVGWFFGSVFAYANIDFSVSDLIGYLEEDSQKLISEEVRAKAKGYRYVLVRGFLNELIFGYMKENKEALIEFGVPEDQIHFVSPCSSTSLERDSRRLLFDLEKIANLGHQPLVLLGHSKGASGIVAFSLLHSDFVVRHVKAVISIQGVYGGSGIADALYFWKSRNPLPKIAYLNPHSLLFALAALVARPVVSGGSMCGLFQGLKSLTHKHNQVFWSHLEKTCEATLPSISKKFLFVRTSQEPHDQVWMLKSLGWYLYHAYGVSDGLVQTNEQYLPWMVSECPVMLTHANHHSLTHSGIATNSPTELRKNFMAALVRGLAR